MVNGIIEKRIRGAQRGYMNINFLVPVHPLGNTEITKYFNYDPKINGVFSRNNLARIKD